MASYPLFAANISTSIYGAQLNNFYLTYHSSSATVYSQKELLVNFISSLYYLIHKTKVRSLSLVMINK